MREALGKVGGWLARVVRCQDDRPVRPHRVRKSVGTERTFRRDVRGAEALAEKLVPIAEELARRLARHRLAGRTVTLKLKSADFQITQRSATLPGPVATEAELMGVGLALLHRPAPPKGALRLIGLTVSALVPADGGRQLVFPFALPGAETDA